MFGLRLPGAFRKQPFPLRPSPVTFSFFISSACFLHHYPSPSPSFAKRFSRTEHSQRRLDPHKSSFQHLDTSPRLQISLPQRKLLNHTTINWSGSSITATPEIKMSARLDQSLDSIIDSQKKTKRTTRRNKPRAAPVGGVKKTLKPARPAVKPAAGPSSRAPKNSKIVVSSLPFDVTENQIKVCQRSHSKASRTTNLEFYRPPFQR